MEIEIALTRLAHHDPALPLPAYETAGAAGMDLRACLPGGGAITLAPGARTLVPTGLAIALPEGFEAQVRPRSGLALKKGLTVANAPGTVDSDYRGEVGHGDRIAQMVIAPVTRGLWREVETLDETARGAGGFGSTGIGERTPG